MDFDDVLSARIFKINQVLGQKAQEYASGANHFHNFDLAARRLKTTPEKALNGMMAKHDVSVQDLIAWSEDDPERITRGLIDEKIGDLINYLILLEGLLDRRLERMHDIVQDNSQ